YWGAATSSVDWCETNYEYSYYVAEMFNSFSSLAMVVIGELGAWLHPKSEFRYRLAFRLISVVGWGSLLFHGTLKYETQMLDELPMCWTAAVLFYCLVKNKYPNVSGWFPIILGVYTALVTAVVSLFSGKVQFYFFHFTFASLELTDGAMILKIYLSKRHGSPTVKRLFELGIGMYVSAMLIWFTDFNFCRYLNGHVAAALGNSTILPFNPQFHAVWHAMVSAGLYCLCLLILVDRQETLGHKAKLHYLLCLIPYV
ncbi:alkaline phytoceramidase family protein, partial [Basidiobolus meristosporus CBS 931.73]